MRRIVSRVALAATPVFLFSVALLSVPACAQLTGGVSDPEPPRSFLDTTDAPSTGRLIAVPAGGDFQAALDAAEPGDVITLEAGATYQGPFVLPDKSGSGWITVRTSAPDSLLPPPGTRVNPSHAPAMPKIVVGSGVGGALQAAPGAHHFRFVGIEAHPLPGAFVFNVIELGSDETSEEQLSRHIVFDRCYIHGDPLVGGRRGIALNSRWTAVVDFYLADFKEVRADSQAIAGWNGPGPFKIVNNYLEAAGENVLFGGADPTIANLVPADIEIRHNHFFKPLNWRIGDPGYEGTPWTVKNLLELKNARRVLIDRNVFEHNWVHAQNGFAILFTVRNQNGAAPWSVVEDVTFRNNILRHTARGITIHGFDNNFPSQQSRRILIQNNLFADVDAERWGGGCCAGWLQVMNGAAEVVVEHNTALHSGNILTAAGEPNPAFVYRNNIALHNAFGIAGSDTPPGKATLSRFFPGAIVEGNVIVGGNPAAYRPGNFFPPSLADVGFVDLAGGNIRLGPSSPFTNVGSNGRDIGVNVDALEAATAGVISGVMFMADDGRGRRCAGSATVDVPRRPGLPLIDDGQLYASTRDERRVTRPRSQMIRKGGAPAPQRISVERSRFRSFSPHAKEE